MCMLSCMHTLGSSRGGFYSESVTTSVNRDEFNHHCFRVGQCQLPGAIYTNPVIPALKPPVQFSYSVLSNSLQPHGLQHARPPCPSPTTGVYSNSCHWVSDAIQPSNPLSSPSPTLYFSQHQGLFKWETSRELANQDISIEAKFNDQYISRIINSEYMC